MSIPYIYSWQILGFALFNLLALTIYRKKINWGRFLKVNAICMVWGIIQINALENYVNVPAWGFHDGVSYWGTAFGHVYWDDIGFVIVCTPLFYWFLFKTKNIADTIPSSYYIWMVCGFIIIETQLYHVCGQGAKDLILLYTLIPILLFVFYCMIKRHKPNVTQLVKFFVLVNMVSIPWEILSALCGWWYYNPTSEAFNLREFYFRGQIPLGITPQYSISGTVVMYSIWTVFCEKEHADGVCS